MNPSPRAPAFIFCCTGFVVAGWLAGSRLASCHVTEAPSNSAAQPAATRPGDDARAELSTTPHSASDLRAAMEQVLAQRDDADRARTLLAAARTFRAEDFAAAFALLKEIGGGRNGWKTMKLRDGLLCDWVGRDLACAREWLKAQSPSEWSQLENGRRAWLRADPRGYVSWLRGLGDEPFQWVGNDNTICEIDPEAALELAQRKGGPSVGVAFGTLARRDPQATAERALNLPPNWDRASALRFVAKAWAGSDREAAFAWASHLDDAALSASALGGIMDKLLEADVPAAARFVAGHPEAAGWYPFAQTGRSLADQYADAALEWARGVQDAGKRSEALAAVIDTIASRDARRAADLWSAENAAAGGKLGSLDTVAAALACTAGADEALRFIDTVPTAERAKAEDSVRKTLAGNRGWEDVAEIARAMPPGARRTEWLAQTARFFATDGDLARAQNFAATLAGPERSAAVQAIGGVVLAEDFDAGARMLAGTVDRAALVAAIRGRFSDDGGRVRSWLARTPLLTPEEKAQLLAPTPAPAP